MLVYTHIIVFFAKLKEIYMIRLTIKYDCKRNAILFFRGGGEHENQTNEGLFLYILTLNEKKINISANKATSIVSKQINFFGGTALCFTRK